MMLRYCILLLPVILLVVFWAAYHLHVDRHLPESPGHLLLAFALGVGSFWLGLLGYRLPDRGAVDLAPVPDP